MQKVIFVDMDGVVVDWYNSAMELMHLDKNDLTIQEAISADHNAFDKLVGRDSLIDAVTRYGRDFWVNLVKLPWADDLMNLLIAKAKDSDAQLAFLSKPGHWVEAYSGKYVWVQKYYPDIPLILCRHKGMVASSHTFLIDDDPIQLDYFYKQGGWTYQWPKQFGLMRKGPTGWQTELALLGSAIDTANS